MKKTGRIILISTSLCFTFIQLIFFNSTFEKEMYDLVVATSIAWFVGLQYDKLKLDQLRRKQSEENYKLLIELLPESVVIQRNNIILYANKAAENMLGAQQKRDLVGRSIVDFIEEGYLEKIQNNKAIPKQPQRPLVNAVCKLTCLNLKQIYFEFSSLQIIFEGKEATLYIGKDITCKREQTESLLQKSEKLAVVGQLAAGIAHEIRNPLTSIKGFIQLVHSETSQHKDFLEIVLAELERINAIIGEFLVLAKPNEVKFKKMNIQPLLDDVVSLINSQAMMENVQINLSYSMQLPQIVCEENQLKQVFINVLKNAIEAMPGGGVIEVGAHKSEDGYITLSFKDQGIGIPEERIPTLGEPFYTTKEKGTGLGLMTCLKIIENHKGDMRIASEVNKGTTIRISLPPAVLSLNGKETKTVWSLKEEPSSHFG
ncbi:ATP-binding protein [Domibacillus sp. PGB-M46]|uniref:ATP-binding protein n=1 Tax=Domibacillus sp. PGB-M46 TaxID=2910255 RepID=UPI001F57FDCA|nr:ATP-binding protein [Domibacillus sp. PGB-M46]MCI2257237.1 ATP-binding protein [Domibacillus sp. PGB-M46]